MDSRRKHSLVSRKIIFVTLALLVMLAALCCLAVYYEAHNRTITPMQTVKMSTFHPRYESVEAMMQAKDASLAAEAVVIDEGKVRSTRDVADENVPPDVHTDYRVRLTKVIKGDVDSREVVITLMGGVVDRTNYVMEGVPRLHKGDRILVVAYHGSDGKYYPLSGSTALSVIDHAGNYHFTSATISGEKRSFTIEELVRAAR